MIDPGIHSTELLAFASGKGGTGKTSLIAALSYALIYSGHKVLVIDTDLATDGFSLFILGPEGMNQLGEFIPQNTFAGILDRFQETQMLDARPRIVHRLNHDDHGLSYEAIISGKNLYGDFEETLPPRYTTQRIDRRQFQEGIRGLFTNLREQNLYDYVLVDTRGGFSFESIDVAAFADSFVLVTEATYTNFYQDRNLLDRINEVAAQTQTKPVLRGIIVNKATEAGETLFRQALTNEFRVRFEDTWPVALDLNAAAAYKTQKVLYREAPASRFAYDSLQAFQRILRIVTSQWAEERVLRWNELVGSVDKAIAEHNKRVEVEKEKEREQVAHFESVRAERERLQLELANLKEAHEQEKRRQDILLQELKVQARTREEVAERERARDQELLRREQSSKFRLMIASGVFVFMCAVAFFYAYWVVNEQRLQAELQRQVALQNERRVEQELQNALNKIQTLEQQQQQQSAPQRPAEKH
ncbi:MAG: AAA family ATPase [Verrucomicrobia bacterium]|nr:AAA family ATPase [Verrucomicrobiota bacterium]